MEGNCSTDLDCSPLKLCYRETKWLEAESGCFCNSYNGWTGDSCLENGPGTLYYLSIISLTLVIGIATVVRAGYSIARLRLDGRLQRNATTLSLALCPSSASCFVCWRIIRLVSLLTPESSADVLTTESGIKNRKDHKLTQVERLFIGMNTAFAVATTLHVAIVWVDTAEKSKHLRTEEGQVLRKFRHFIAVLEVTWVVASIILYPISPAALFLVAILFLLIIIATYTYARREIVDILGRAASSNGSSEDLFRQLIRQMNCATIGVVLSSLLILIGGTAYTVLSWNDWRYWCEPGKICPVMAANEFIGIGLSLNGAVLSMFLYSVSISNTRASLNTQSLQASITSI
mmetsp:Transcript_6935/g.7987  ORF Transcript_6935/g.7987 Transcript_6935/m.7987 type:complete len:346 (-) Transcript_6935:44-1081(-)